MTNPNDLPAFPAASPGNIRYSGMTLRDYFAIHAPNPIQVDVTLQTKRKGWEEGKGVDGKELKLNEIVERTLMIHAELRYQYADAMLKERDKC